MQQTLDTHYIYLDGEAERKHLIHAIMATRTELRQIIQQTPSSQLRHKMPGSHYSLAGLLAHLNFVDDMAFTMMKLARWTVRPGPSFRVLRRVNHWAVAWVSRQPMDVLLHHMDNNQERIIDFILTLPIDDFSKPVFDPRQGRITTLEKAIQDFWLTHWVAHIDAWVRVKTV